MSPAEVAARAERLAATVESESRYGQTRDLVVVHEGREVLARHFGDGSGGELVDTYSMTKSFVATLVGTALDRGAIASLDEAVSRYLPGARHSYTVRHLLTMTAGTQATRAQTRGGGPESAAYGYLWWTAQEPVPHFFAGGYAGQSLTVIPELGVVAVTAGDEAQLRSGWRNARHAVLSAFAE